jgi:hypothetical protein
MLVPRAPQIVGYKQMEILGLPKIFASAGGKQPPLLPEAYHRGIHIGLAGN